MEHPFESEPDEMRLSISEVSALTGITQSNLRFFEEAGILRTPPRNGAGRRVYFRQDMEELMGLVCLKNAGMELKEIKRFFKLVRQGDATLHERHRMLQESHENLKLRIKEFQKCLKYSAVKMDYIRACCEAYDRGEPLPQVNPGWLDNYLKPKL